MGSLVYQGGTCSYWSEPLPFPWMEASKFALRLMMGLALPAIPICIGSKLELLLELSPLPNSVYFPVGSRISFCPHVDCRVYITRDFYSYAALMTVYVHVYTCMLGTDL